MLIFGLNMCYAPAMEIDFRAKGSEILPPPTFESEMKRYDSDYAKIFELYPHDEDEDLLGQHCDGLREERIPAILGLAKSKAELRQVFGLTMERNKELRAKITAKMETLKPQA
jgi:hypothetical protein